MKIIGYALITLGFLAAAHFATLPAVEGAGAAETPLGPFLGGLGVGVLGVILVRVAVRQQATHEDRLSTDIETIEASLVSLVEKAEALDREKADLDVYDLRHLIDERFPPDLDAFVQARGSISHSFSLQAYADVMSPFAIGERHINRVWSASTDGYIDEAHTYIGLAKEQFEEALRVFRGLKPESSA